MDTRRDFIKTIIGGLCATVIPVEEVLPVPILPFPADKIRGITHNFPVWPEPVLYIDPKVLEDVREWVGVSTS